MRAEPAVFPAVIDAEGRVRLDFPAQQKAICKHKFSEQCVEVEIRLVGTKRTDAQNRALHALLREWGMASGQTPDALKYLMLGIAFGHIEQVMPFTGEIAHLLAKPSSSRLTVHEFCHLIEEVLRVAAENGTFLQAPEEYRRAKEAAAKKARRAA